jgi:hypothetical protein
VSVIPVTAAGTPIWYGRSRGGEGVVLRRRLLIQGVGDGLLQGHRPALGPCFSELRFAQGGAQQCHLRLERRLISSEALSPERLEQDLGGAQRSSITVYEDRSELDQSA